MPKIYDLQMEVFNSIKQQISELYFKLYFRSNSLWQLLIWCQQCDLLEFKNRTKIHIAHSLRTIGESAENVWPD